MLLTQVIPICLYWFEIEFTGDKSAYNLQKFDYSDPSAWYEKTKIPKGFTILEQ